MCKVLDTVLGTQQVLERWTLVNKTEQEQEREGETVYMLLNLCSSVLPLLHSFLAWPPTGRVRVRAHFSSVSSFLPLFSSACVSFGSACLAGSFCQVCLCLPDPFF